MANAMEGGARVGGGISAAKFFELYSTTNPYVIISPETSLEAGPSIYMRWVLRNF